MRLVCAALLVSVGCGGPATYRLVGGPDRTLLIPPGVKDPGVIVRRLRVPASRCVAPEGAPATEARGRKLRVAVDREQMESAPAGALARWGTELESAGCLETGQGWAAAQRAARSLPLEPSTARKLLTPSERSDGYIDLRPGHRLRVASPVFAEGAPANASTFEQVGPTEVQGPASLTVTVKTSDDVRGFELDWYAVERAAGGARIVPLSAELFVEGEPQQLDAPRSNPFVFHPSAAYFRLMFLARLEVDPDHDILVLGAATPTALEERYDRIRAEPSLCGEEVGFCAAAPRETAFLPFITAMVNGKEVRLPPGSRLRSALREAGLTTTFDTVDALRVEKPFGDGWARVEFDSDEILDLPLEGGERLAVAPR